ncbi:MAG: hypothetical protein QM831_41105 [Kofleriaceae bacterium]
MLFLDPIIIDARAEVSGITTVHSPHAEPDQHDLVLAGGRAGVVLGAGDVAYHVAGDAAIGASTGNTADGTEDRNGFAYALSLLPLGFAWRIDKQSTLTLGTGIGASGATGGLDDVVTVPVELTYEGGSDFHLMTRLRVAYAFEAVTRAPSLGNHVVGELFAGLAMAMDEKSDGAFYFGVLYEEMYDARYAGAAIGYRFR